MRATPGPVSLGGQYEQETLFDCAGYASNLWVYVLKSNTKLSLHKEGPGDLIPKGKRLDGIIA
jgi:hypothetical protein